MTLTKHHTTKRPVAASKTPFSLSPTTSASDGKPLLPVVPTGGLDYPAKSPIVIVAQGARLTVESGWRGDHWEHRIPGHTCDHTWCPCVSFIREAEAGLHEWICHLLRHYVRFGVSTEDYWWGMDKLEELGLSLVTARIIAALPRHPQQVAERMVA